MEKEKLLEILENSKQYDLALMTTFNFDVGFFEKAIVNRLIRNSIRKIAVFIDSKELAKAIISSGDNSLGKKYSINPVVMQGSFHPKMILLLGEKKARLIIGSANLTFSGYCINNEVFNCIDYDSEHRDFRDIIFSAISFFKSLNQDCKHTYRLDDDVVSAVNSYRYVRPAEENGKVFLLHSLEKPIVEQLQEIIDAPVKEVHIAVPYYDNDLSAYRILQESFPNASFHLYLQQNKSTFPVSKFREEFFSGTVHAFEKLDAEGKENSRFYHGKVFLIKTNSSAYVLYGSSNCTQSALTRTIKDGNVECNLLVRGEPDAYDPFFDGFIISDAVEIKSKLMTYGLAPEDDLFFMFGEAEDVIKLHVGYYHKPKDIAFYYEDGLLEYEEQDDHFVITLESAENTVFNIRAVYNGKSETIRCWYNDYRMLKLFRIDTTDVTRLVDREDYATGEKFKEDYERILQAEVACNEDVDEWERLNHLVLQPDGGAENDAVEPSEEEDFIVKVDVSDEDYDSYQQYKTVAHIRGRIKARFLSNMSIPYYYRRGARKQNVAVLTEEIEPIIQHRKATSEEKQFERFVKRKVRTFTYDNKESGDNKKRFFNRLSFDHYFGIVTVLFETFQKYRSGGVMVDDIFIDSYVVPAQINLLKNLIEEYDSAKESPEELLRFSFNTLLDNHARIESISSQTDRENLEMQNKRLLGMIEDRFAVRTRYEEYLIQLENGVFTTESQERFDGAKIYIESLYGYKTIDQIRLYLQERFGESSALEIINKTAKAVVYVQEPSDYIRPDDALVSEMSRYAKNGGKISTFRMVVIGSGDSRIDKIEHTINLEYRKLTTNIYRKSGMNTIGKPQYYNF